MASKTWDSFHRRGEVLRAVVEEANVRRDGVIPMELPGVAETFGGGRVGAGMNDERAVQVGRALEEKARAAYDPVASAAPRHRADSSRNASIIGRRKAHLAA